MFMNRRFGLTIPTFCRRDCLTLTITLGNNLPKISGSHIKMVVREISRNTQLVNQMRLDTFYLDTYTAVLIMKFINQEKSCIIFGFICKYEGLISFTYFNSIHIIPFIFSKAGNAFEKISHKTPLGNRASLATQYEATGDPRVEIRTKTQ